MRNADTIVVMSQGQVAEQGSHAELLARRGIYASLVERQRSGIDDSDRDMAPADPHVRTTACRSAQTTLQSCARLMQHPEAVRNEGDVI